MTSRISIGRLRFVVGAFGLAFAILAVRLVWVQCLFPKTPGRAERTERKVIREARRGAIWDVHGVLLAHSRHVYNLRADPVVIGTNAAEFARFAAPILRMSERELLQKVTPNPVWVEKRYRSLVTNQLGQVEEKYRPGYVTNRSVVVRQGVDADEWDWIRSEIQKGFVLEALDEGRAAWREIRAVKPDLSDKARALLTGQLQALNDYRDQELGQRRYNEALKRQEREIAVNGIVADKIERRFYPLEALAAHVLGHTRLADDEAGKPGDLAMRGVMGVERRFDVELQGSAGQTVTHMIMHRSKRRELAFLRDLDAGAEDGLHVRLTLDARIQSIVEEALDEGVARLSPSALVCVVVRPSTGEILAMANRPTFNPNDVHNFPLNSRLNRAISMPTEPGSTIKMMTYAAAIDQGVATMQHMIDCEEGLWTPPSGRAVRDVEGMRLSVVTLEDAFARSSNVAAAKLGLQLPVDTLIHYMTRMGYLKKSGIFYRNEDDWGAEGSGGVPGMKRMNMELQGRLSYGYGIYVTPLQTAMAAAAIANDGVLMAPMLAHSLMTAEGHVVRRYQPTVVGRAVRPEVAKQVRQAMRRVVTDGTGKPGALDDFAVAAKTGTSHKVDSETGRQSSDKYVSTFVGFFPYEKPELCILVLADEPLKRGRTGYQGGSGCGPIFKKIAQEAASRLALSPSGPIELAHPWDRTLQTAGGHP